MTVVRSPIRGQVRSQVRGGAQPPVGRAPFYDGIHLDFRSARHYVKPVGGSPTVAPFTDLFTFTGDNKSYYRGASGLLIPSQTNTPRIEYDASGNVLGLLIEGSRTNLGLWSNDLTNAAWVKTNATAALTSIGPDGVANSATRLTATAGNGTALQTVVSASATRANTVWLKRATGTGNIDMTVDNGVTWTTKTLTTSWARYEITQAAVTNPVFGLRIVTSGDAIDVYGEQLESATFGSSLIPTTTVGVTRAADVAVRTTGGEISQSAGSLYVEFDVNDATLATGKVAVDISDNTLNNLIWGYMSASKLFTLAVTTGGVGQASESVAGALVANTNYKGAGAWASNEAVGFLGGAKSAGDVGVTLPTTTKMNVGGTQGIAASALFGHIRRLDYWPERKSDAFLQQVTA